MPLPRKHCRGTRPPGTPALGTRLLGVRRPGTRLPRAHLSQRSQHRASQPPGAAALAAVQSTVTVTAIDLESRIVQFQDPDGNKYQVKAGPELSIDKLVVGDRLLATYAATLAIAVNKKP